MITKQTKPDSVQTKESTNTLSQRLKPYWLFLAVILLNLLLGLFQPSLALSSLKTSRDYLWEMLTFIPPIFILMGLLDVWVPRELVEKHVGPGSGWRGIALAIFVGTAAAGPLYAAFPLAATLWRKGAKVANVMIFLNTWAAIKIPMITVELKYFGPPFALLRLALTLPAVILIGFLIEHYVPHSREMT
ncbi:MAG: permease [Desulfitobacteriaceae bacterium]|nr:permease [Desulfitobacteriaceae bacterium]MDI6880320.1 permease [Desulfitobacteriaceae bacterium]MDI6915696.1 permease [Desulfitobacteriaceae bacterium]